MQTPGIGTVYLRIRIIRSYSQHPRAAVECLYRHTSFTLKATRENDRFYFVKLAMHQWVNGAYINQSNLIFDFKAGLSNPGNRRHRAGSLHFLSKWFLIFSPPCYLLFSSEWKLVRQPRGRCYKSLARAVILSFPIKFCTTYFLKQVKLHSPWPR